MHIGTRYRDELLHASEGCTSTLVEGEWSTSSAANTELPSKLHAFEFGLILMQNRGCCACSKR